MKTLLAPIDFSDATQPILAETAKLAAAFRARVVLLHVVEPVATYMPVGASMDVLTTAPNPEPQDVESINRRLESLADRIKASAASVDCRAVIGLAIDEILTCASEEKADVIVLGSHGHGALYHLFSGSVVTGILKRAQCPVLMVPVKSPAP